MTISLQTPATTATATPTKESPLKKAPSTDRVSDLDVIASKLNGLKRIPSYESLNKVMAILAKKTSHHTSSADSSPAQSISDKVCNDTQMTVDALLTPRSPSTTTSPTTRAPCTSRTRPRLRSSPTTR